MPLLIEVVEKIDDNSELLVALCKQIAIICKTYNNAKSICASDMLKLLETIGSNDDCDVRNKACSTLGEVSSLLCDEEFEEYYLPIVKRLCKGDLYPLKIGGSLLIPTCYSRIDQVTQTLLLSIYKDLSKDDTPMVRRAAATIIGKMSETVNALQIKTDILPIFQSLVKDEQDAIKVALIENSLPLFRLCKKEDSIEVLFQSVKACSEDKKSWRLRYIIAEILSQIVPSIDSDIATNCVVPIICALLVDSEHEVRSVMVSTLGGFSTNLNKDEYSKKMLPLLCEKTLKDSSEYVRISLAKVAGSLCSQLGNDQTKPQLFALVNGILADENSEVRINALENLSPLLSILNALKLRPYYYQQLNSLLWISVGE